MDKSPVGIGNHNAKLVVYIANRPPLDEFIELDGIRPLTPGEIRLIGETTGNHWRKIYNCFAKLVFELGSQGEASWQALRDKQLLGESSDQLLLFSPTQLSVHQDAIKIICGKTYFKQLKLEVSVEWVDDYFAINSDRKLIVSPYFDYRQLSNRRISQLAGLVRAIMSAH